MIRKLALAAAFSLLSSAAFALCPTPLTVKDAAGTTQNITTVVDGSGNCMSSIGGWAGGALGAMANYGTSPGAVLVPGVNAFVTNTPPVSQSGTWTVRNVGNAGAIFDFAGQNAASPANSILMGAQFQTTPTTVTAGNASPLQMDNAGNLLVNIKAGASSGAVAQGSTTSGQSGQLVQGAVTTSPPSYTTAQTSPLSLDTQGNLRVAVLNSNANGQAAMASSSPVVISSDQTAIKVQGGAASGATAAGNPVQNGGLAVSSETVVTNGQAAALVTDLARKLIVLPYANPENFVSGVISSAMTGTTSTSLIAAPAAGLRNYITQCTFSNSHATVGTDILIQDGSGGTTLYLAPLAPAYGGATITFPVPLRQPTTATAIFVQNVTTGSNTKAACSGYKGA